MTSQPKAETQMCVASHQTCTIKREASNLAEYLNRWQNTLARGHWRVSTFGQNLDTDWQCNRWTNRGAGKHRGTLGKTRDPGEDKGPWGRQGALGVGNSYAIFRIFWCLFGHRWEVDVINKQRKEQDPSIPSSLLLLNTNHPSISLSIVHSPPAHSACIHDAPSDATLRHWLVLASIF